MRSRSSITDIWRDWRKYHDPRRQGTHLANRQLGLCKLCGAYIVWVCTEKGKTMPLDPDPDPDGQFYLTQWLDSGGRRVVHYAREGQDVSEHTMYASHFATCTEREAK